MKTKRKASLAGLKEWVRNNRSRPLRELAAALRRRFTGYFNYYGVIGNSERLWAGFLEMWKTLAIPNPHIVKKPCQRTETWNLSTDEPSLAVSTSRPLRGARCGKTARRDLRGG